TQARADGRGADLLDFHGSVWAGADGGAVGGVSRAVGSGDGGSVADGTGTGLGVISGETSRQGTGVRAELVGDRVRTCGARESPCHAALGMAWCVLRRRAAGALHALDPAPRRGAG